VTTTADYDRREKADTLAQIGALADQSLSDRREAKADYTGLMADLHYYTRTLDWMLGGDYGRGAYLLTRECLANKRMNRAAYLGALVAALEARCPDREARAAYTALPSEIREKLDAAVAAWIAEAEVQIKAEAEAEAA
jgi:hypothetical protein